MRGGRLGDAIARQGHAAQLNVVGCCGQGRGSGEGRGHRSGKVHVEFEDLQAVGSTALGCAIHRARKEVRRPIRRRIRAFKIRGEDPRPCPRRDGGQRRQGEPNERRRVAAQHARAIKGEDPEARTFISRHVISVRPDADLGIIGQFRGLKFVEVPSVSDRVRPSGNRDALMEARCTARYRELAHEPAVGQVIVLHDRITVVFRLAGAAKPGPK